MKYRGEGLHPVISTIFSGFDGSVVTVVAVVLPLAGSQSPKLVQITSQVLREFRKATPAAEFLGTHFLGASRPQRARQTGTASASHK
jgi:hypothetical protein